MGISRRRFLQTAVSASALPLTGSLGLAGQSSANKLLLIVLTGGPSQLDTWDPKPDSPSDVRGPFEPIQTAIPGVLFTELFPRMAAMADRFQVVRSVHHTAAPIHETGFQLFQTGQIAPLDQPGMPLVCRRGPGVLASAPLGFTGVQLDRGQTGLSVPKLDISHDAAARRRFGGNTFGDDCLRACRLLQNGHTGVVVNMFTDVYDTLSWDCHAAGGSLGTRLTDYRHIGPMFDVAFTALLEELSQTGLIDETLVVASGEFGRTPKLNSGGGRDHWAGVWSAVRAGAGIPGGTVIGASDRIGSEPNESPMLLEHLCTGAM